MSQIYEMHFGYHDKKWYSALTPEKRQEIRDRFPMEKFPGEEKLGEYWDVTMMANAEDLRYLSDLGATLEIKRVKGLAYGRPDVPHDLAEYEQRGGPTIYNVSVPNVGLLDVKAVTWLEDCCTESLQHHLDKGWKIIAVCPPNDSRRPTYILGHTQRDIDPMVCPLPRY